jgi:hypothetical protein
MSLWLLCGLHGFAVPNTVTVTVIDMRPMLAAAECWLFCRSMLAPNVNKYCLTIEPGVDAAFIVALALLSDEIFHDDNR